ncbi:hypothetical protein OZ411_03850 [Bradyrhizobium sp. Arg237L]|uniref:hypothetical protein n=1 Tax=Bradyrhizobium sp. Arg237L TaxID=3003352 RepID=UPI00249F37D2|nr:hypothetical protein [Bradyrhizobium sp. Arg237L]MDI4231946.1 hypothetical protein [Bradyrhizobium sp. Arg237L]
MPRFIGGDQVAWPLAQLLLLTDDNKVIAGVGFEESPDSKCQQLVREGLARDQGFRQARPNALAGGEPKLAARGCERFRLQIVRSTWLFTADRLRLVVSCFSAAILVFGDGFAVSWSLRRRSILVPY